MQIDIRVLGGLEITVEFTTGYEDGECGYPGHYVEEWYVVAIAGRNLRKGEKCDWLYKRIEAAKEEDKIVEACCEHASDSANDYDDNY